MQLRGTTAIVTGGGHRLGRAIVLELANAGCSVVINYHRSEPAALQTRDAARTLGASAEVYCADVADPDQARALVEYAHTCFGSLEVLVANAGVFRRTPIDTTTQSDWDDMLRGNLAVFSHCARFAAEAMRTGGAVVALADVAGIKAWADYLPYSVAKACVIAFVQRLAVEFAPRVRVNAVAPGPVLFPPDYPADLRQREIDRTLLRRQGTPSDIAAAVRFLAEADYITGTVLPVDGGRLLARRDV